MISFMMMLMIHSDDDAALGGVFDAWTRDILGQNGGGWTQVKVQRWRSFFFNTQSEILMIANSATINLNVLLD